MNVMANDANKLAIISAIWDNPSRVFGCEFKKSGQYQSNLKNDKYDEAGRIRLWMNPRGTSMRVFCNGGFRMDKAEKWDIFTYLDEFELHAGGFWHTLKQCADIYGITLELSEQIRKRITRESLAREVVASLIESLRLNPEGVAAKYIRDVRGLEIDGKHFGELTNESIKRAKDSLTRRGIAFTEKEFNNLFLTNEEITEEHHTAEDLAKWGYNVVIPSYCSGSLCGFILRNTRKDATHKIRNPEDIGRRGYCDRLDNGEPAVFVEGPMDAIRLIQAGVKNVIGMCGPSVSDDIMQLLDSRNITQVTYIPDHELDKKTGTKRTNLIDGVITKFLAAKVDGEPVVKNLYICELPLPEGKTKFDADDYGKKYGNAALVEHLDGNAVTWWAYKLDELVTTATDRGDVNISWFQNEFDKIYNDCGNVYERQRIKDYIKGKAEFSAFGVTPEALNDKDELIRDKEYRNRIQAGATELAAAIEKGTNPATIAGIVARLQDAQSTNTRAEWDKQLNQTFEDELKMIADQPDTVPTRWELGVIGKDKNYHHREDIEYYPADLAVFCASTSHGKTMFLMQSALNVVTDTGKTVLYISCEENKRQLLERSLNVFLDIATVETKQPTDTPTDKNGNICFRKGTRKKAIKAALRGADICKGYHGYMGVSDEFKALKTRIMHGVEQYKRTVRPRLIFVHTDGTAESLAANAARVVTQIRERGEDVAAVFVDYVQLLYSENKTYSRTDELKGVCSALKSCAERLELPVIVGAQLNRNAVKDGIDSVTVANLGESTDIERIAHDLYLIWQVDKTKEDTYFTTAAKKGNGQPPQEQAPRVWNYAAEGDRSKRIFAKTETHPNERELKRGYMYVEQLKARDGQAGGWGLFPFEGERGTIGTIDKDKMQE